MKILTFYESTFLVGACGLMVLAGLSMYRQSKSRFALYFILLAWLCLDPGLEITLEAAFWPFCRDVAWNVWLHNRLLFRLLLLILAVILIGCGWFASRREKPSKYAIVAFAVVALFALWSSIDHIFWLHIKRMLGFPV